MKNERRLHVGFNDYEILNINGEDWVRCEDVPKLAKLLYGREAMIALDKVIDSVEIKYDEASNSMIVTRKEDNKDA